MHHPQVELAIAIKIEPSTCNGPLPALNARLRGYVLKLSVAKVPVQNVAIDSRDKQIRMPIVVIITYGGTHRVARARHAGLSRHVAKLPVAFIAIQPVPIFGRRFLQ